MLWLQFSAAFHKNQCYKFSQKTDSTYFEQKAPIFSPNFPAKIFLKSKHRSHISRIIAIGLLFFDKNCHVSFF
jgi:hypothetical protein